MNLEIVKYPHKRLDIKCLEISCFSRELSEIGQSLVKAMEHGNGIGLAANQVNFGPLIRMFVTSTLPDNIICNPTWKPTPSGFDYERVEGCLSFPGWIVPVKRFDAIIAEYRKIDGKKVKCILKGLAAQVFQHETEHLDGKTMIEHLNDAQKNTINNHYGKKGV